LHFFLKKVDDLFSRRPQNTSKAENHFSKHSHPSFESPHRTKISLKIDSYSAWGALLPGGALTTYLCKLRPFFLRPGGAGYAYTISGSVTYGCQSSRSTFQPNSRSAFRPFDLPTRSRSNKQSVRLLYIDCVHVP